MWQGEPCQDCRTLEDELAELRVRLKERDAANNELEERIDNLRSQMKIWEGTVSRLALDIQGEWRP